MKIFLGNANPHDQGVPIPGPTVTITSIGDSKNEDGSYSNGYIVGTDADEVRDHLFFNQGPVTHLPGNGAILNLVLSWPDHGRSTPTWVKVEAGERDETEAEDFERFLSEYWKCERGVPQDIEDTHYTAYSGSNQIYAPGEAPEGE